MLSNLIFSGVLERFPKLKFASVESGVGWIPFLLEALDYQLEEEVPGASEILSMTPSEYFRRQIYGCFWFERKGLGAAINALGPDNLMFESDFPILPVCIPNRLATSPGAGGIESRSPPQGNERKRRQGVFEFRSTKPDSHSPARLGWRVPAPAGKGG